MGKQKTLNLCHVRDQSGLNDMWGHIINYESMPGSWGMKDDSRKPLSIIRKQQSMERTQMHRIRWELIIRMAEVLRKILTRPWYGMRKLQRTVKDMGCLMQHTFTKTGKSMTRLYTGLKN